MIRMLNHGTLLRGLKLSRYQKLASNFKYYPPSNTSWSWNVLSVREISGYTKKKSVKSIKLQTSFNIPLSYDVIYVSHEYHTFMQHFFTIVPTGVTILGIVQLFINYEALLPDYFTSAVHLWVVTVFYWTCIWSAVMGYRTPIRIYHNKTDGIYKAVFNGLLPTKYKILEFKKGSVTRLLPADEVTLFKNSTFSIQGQKIYMFIDSFRYPADLYNMFDEQQYE